MYKYFIFDILLVLKKEQLLSLTKMLYSNLCGFEAALCSAKIMLLKLNYFSVSAASRMRVLKRHIMAVF